MANITKWGFGMAPLKEKTDQQNRNSLIFVRDFVIGNGCLGYGNILDEISRVKGIFNRIIKQDQWDWFTVYMYLDYPLIKDINSIVCGLSTLRTAIINKDEQLGRKSLTQLLENKFIVYCNNYLDFRIDQDSCSEYLYILSRREEKDILKIGMTTRNVQKRVNEINSATGIIYPLSARKVYKVKDCKVVEKEVHKLLSEYRIRTDREFFKIEYAKACRIIEEYLECNHLHFYD